MVARAIEGYGQDTLALPAFEPFWTTLFAQVATQRPVVVLEVVGPPESLRFLCSTLGDGGTGTFLSINPADLVGLSRWISDVLETWRPRRKDDPFEREDWRAFEKRLERELEPLLGDCGHLIVIEHTCLEGLPWHVAARRWTCSYAASWTDLIAADKRSPTSPTSVGAFGVPRYGENGSVIAALDHSAEQAAKLAASLDLRYDRVSGVDADRAALKDLLGRCSVVQLLCHGYGITKEFEVGVATSHNGTLPILQSVALTGPLGRPYRFNWTDCWSLARAPSVVFSAACGSGFVHVAGMNERFGLHAGLRRGGCHTYVAPRWILFVEDTLPVLDRALETYMTNSVSQAVHQACREAESNLPLRLAWNISIEGDFR